MSPLRTHTGAGSGTSHRSVGGTPTSNLVTPKDINVQINKTRRRDLPLDGASGVRLRQSSKFRT